MKEGTKQFLILALVLAVGALVLFISTGGLTGFAIVETAGQTAFDEGVYSNAIYNGSAVVLSGANEGSYTSKVFDAGLSVLWDGFDYSAGVPTRGLLLAVDGTGAVYSSVDGGASWTEKTAYYGRDVNTREMISYGNDLYILFSGTPKEIYKSSDYGASWTLVNGAITTAISTLVTGGVDLSGSFYAISSIGRVLKSFDKGLIWSEFVDFNGAANGEAKGIAVKPNNELFIVDGSGAVYSSLNEGASWTKKTSSYGGASNTDDIEVAGNEIYILLDKKIYSSSDGGTSWSIINSSFSPYTSSYGLELLYFNNKLYLADGAGRVFSSANGVTWSELGDFNGAAINDIKGLAGIDAETSIGLKVRNCSLADCSDGSFFDYNNAINLTGRYFQYKAELSGAGAVSPYLESVSISYSPISIPSPPAENESAGNETAGNETIANETITNETIGEAPSENESNGTPEENITLEPEENVTIEENATEGAGNETAANETAGNETEENTTISSPVVSSSGGGRSSGGYSYSASSNNNSTNLMNSNLSGNAGIGGKASASSGAKRELTAEVNTSVEQAGAFNTEKRSITGRFVDLLKERGSGFAVFVLIALILIVVSAGTYLRRLRRR